MLANGNIYEYMLWTAEVIAGFSTAAPIYAEWRPYEMMNTAETKQQAIHAARNMMRWVSLGFVGYGVSIGLLIIVVYGHMSGKA